MHEVDSHILQNVPPPIWESLPSEDRIAFTEFRKHFSKTKSKHIGTLTDELEMFKYFIYRRKDNVCERGILTGILFFEDVICVNIQQLKMIMNCCKSTINNEFQLIGYKAFKFNVKMIIERFIPSLVKYPKILRKWTLRIKKDVDSNMLTFLNDINLLKVERSNSTSNVKSNVERKPNFPIPSIVPSKHYQNSAMKKSLTSDNFIFTNCEPNYVEFMPQCDDSFVNQSEYPLNYQFLDNDSVLEYMNDDGLNQNYRSIDFGFDINSN